MSVGNWGASDDLVRAKVGGPSRTRITSIAAASLDFVRLGDRGRPSSDAGQYTGLGKDWIGGGSVVGDDRRDG